MKRVAVLKYHPHDVVACDENGHLTISINKPTLTEVALSAAAICAKNEATLCEIFPYG